MATMVIAIALLVEYRTRLDAWLTVPEQPAEVDRWLAAQPRSVVAEVPFARADALHSISDGLYMFHSTWHWQPIVNGYSGFFPRTFIELAEHTATFPDDRSIDYLKRRGVDLIVVHGSLMEREAFGEMTASLLARPDIEALANFEERWAPMWFFAFGDKLSAAAGGDGGVPSTALGRPTSEHLARPTDGTFGA